MERLRKDGSFTACFETNLANPFLCSVGPKCASLEGAEVGVSSILSGLLAAQMKGSKLDIYVSDSQCLWVSGSNPKNGWLKLSLAVTENN